jgi:hypothetical protein
MSSRKVQSTKNYRLFAGNDENRPLDLKKHRKLEKSMKKYGFLACFPIVCWRNKEGKLIVKDGQHRLAIAEALGLTVYWIEEETDFDVAVINCTSKTWTLKDYARKFAANGLKDYQEGMEFADRHGIPIGIAFAMLGGTTTFGNIQNHFEGGTFRIKDRKWAEAVAGVYGPMVTLSPSLRAANFLGACMAVCRVPDFDAKRLLSCSERCREKLVAYSTRDAYLQMIEDVYNFGRKQLVGLKSQAMMAMRERNAVAPKKPKAEEAA